MSMSELSRRSARWSSEPSNDEASRSQSMASPKASAAPFSPVTASCALPTARSSDSACSARGRVTSSSSNSSWLGPISSMRRSTKAASSRRSSAARLISSMRSSSLAAARACASASAYASCSGPTRSAAQASSKATCAAGSSRRWCSCWPQRSMVAPMVAPSSRTEAMCPSICTRPRPAASTRRRTTQPSGSPPLTYTRASTSSASAPSRIAEASARSPTSSFMALSSAVLPAPVSPVSTVRPAAGVMAASRMSATLRTQSSSIMAPRYRLVLP